MSSSDELNKMDTLANKQHVVSALFSSGLSAYKWSKAFTVAQLPILEKPLDFAQNQVVSLATGALSQAKLNPETVVNKLDSKALDFIVYFDVEQKYALAKKSSAKPIKIVADVKEGACARVSGIQSKASKSVDTLLAGAEKTVDSYLPSNGKADLFDADATKVARIQSLSLATSRRLKKRVMDKFSDLRIRDTQLGRYAEFLDVAVVRERVSSSAVGSKVLNSEAYATVKGFVVTKAVPCAENLGNQFGKYKTDFALATQTHVFTPAKDFYAIATAEFIKLTKSTEDLLKNPKEFTTKYVDMVKAAMGEGWSEKLAQPTETFFGVCKSAYAQVQKACPEGQVEKVEALVTALRIRLASEWETRVKPAIAKVKAQ